MQFTTLEELDSFIDALSAQYMSKSTLNPRTPVTDALINDLIGIRLEVIAADIKPDDQYLDADTVRNRHIQRALESTQHTINTLSQDALERAYNATETLCQD